MTKTITLIDNDLYFDTVVEPDLYFDTVVDTTHLSRETPMTLDEITQEQDKLEHQNCMDMLDEPEFEDLKDLIQPFPITDLDD